MMFNDIEDSNGHRTQVLALRAHDAANVIVVKVLVSNGSGWRLMLSSVLFGGGAQGSC